MAKKKIKEKEENLKFIAKIIDDNKISPKEIKNLSAINHPIFSFRQLNDCSIKECSDHTFFYDFIMRLQKLSELGWDNIRLSDRHSFGMEKIPVHKIKRQLPKFITPDVKELSAFRANGNNLPFVGIQEGKIFHILFIEAKFGDIYDHE